MKVVELCKDENTLRNYFDSSYEIQCLIENVLNRFEDCEIKSLDNLLFALDDELIYYEDMWNILKEYCLPTDCDWNYAIEQFTHLLIQVATFSFDMID